MFYFMKITICGSMKFAKEMKQKQRQLQDLGYEVEVPVDISECIQDPSLNTNIDYCEDVDIIKDHFKKISESDAILVLNYPKNGITGYVGGSTLMETAIAYYLNKKIFYLYDIPNKKDLSYAVEIELMKPFVINNDLSLLKYYLEN